MIKLDTGRLFDGAGEEERARVRCLVDTMNDLGYSAANAAYEDIVADPSFFDQMRKQAKFEFVSTNVVICGGTQPYLHPYRIVSAGTYKIAILGVSAAAKAPIRLPDGTSVVAIDPLAPLGRYVEELRSRVQLVVVLARLPSKDAARLAQEIQGVDLILGGDGAYVSPGLQPEFVSQAFMLYGGDQGKFVGKIDAYPNGSSINKLVAHLVPLDDTFKDDPRTAALVAHHRAESDEKRKAPASPQGDEKPPAPEAEGTAAQTQRM